MEFYGRTKFSLKIISQEGMHFRTTKPKSKDVWSLWINTTAEMCFMHCIVAAYRAPNLASLIKKNLAEQINIWLHLLKERSAYDLRSSTNTIYGSSRCGPFHFPELLTFFFFWERGYGLAADRLGEIYLGIDMHTHRSLDEISPVALTCTTIHGGNSDRLIGSWSQSRCTHKLSVEASKCMQVKARAMDI